MAIERLSFSGADGANATTSNTDFNTISVTDKGTLTHDHSWKPRDGTSIKGVGTTENGQNYAVLNIDGTDTLAYDMPITPLKLPSSGDLNFIRFAGGSALNLNITVISSGALRIRDSGSAVVATVNDALKVDRPCIVSVWVKRHPTDGEARLTVFDMDGKTVLVDSGLKTAVKTGDNPTSSLRTAATKGQGTTVDPSYQFGEPRYDRAASGLLPAWRKAALFRVWDGRKYIEPSRMRGYDQQDATYRAIPGGQKV